MKLFLSLWDLVHLIFYSLNDQQDEDDDDRHEAAATSNRNWFYLQVPELVPMEFDAEFITAQLPVVRYQDLIMRKTSGQSHSSCVVCMNVIEGSDQVRELCNCEHVFRRDCLDGWISRQQLTCPLCRAELLNPGATTSKLGKDPWRAKRMVYLFGEDVSFKNLLHI